MWRYISWVCVHAVSGPSYRQLCFCLVAIASSLVFWVVVLRYMTLFAPLSRLFLEMTLSCWGTLQGVFSNLHIPLAHPNDTHKITRTLQETIQPAESTDVPHDRQQRLQPASGYPATVCTSIQIRINTWTNHHVTSLPTRMQGHVLNTWYQAGWPVAQEVSQSQVQRGGTVHLCAIVLSSDILGTCTAATNIILRYDRNDRNGGNIDSRGAARSSITREKGHSGCILKSVMNNE